MTPSPIFLTVQYFKYCEAQYRDSHPRPWVKSMVLNVAQHGWSHGMQNLLPQQQSIQGQLNLTYPLVIKVMQ